MSSSLPPSSTPSKQAKPGSFTFTPQNTLNKVRTGTSREAEPFVFGSSPQDQSLGDSTSLFDSFSASVKSAIGSANMARDNVNFTVHELEGSAVSSSSMEKSQPAVSQPKFGTTSTLQNRLPVHREKQSIFYIPKKGVPRPEHHRPSAPNTQQPSGRNGIRVPSGPAAREGLQTGGTGNPSAPLSQKPPLAQGAHGFTNTATFSMPSAQPGQGFGAMSFKAPLQTFSSLGDQTFQPVSVKPSALNPRVVHDLTQDDNSDNDYNPDAYISKDPIEYMSSEAANDNIKALLEGAFSDEQPDATIKRRLPQRKRAIQAVKSVGNSLADRLNMLRVKDEATVPETDEDNDAENDGVVDGLSVKLLPHQIDGVTWMLDKESGEKKRGIVPNGGILADDMGLGKTIQALSLLLMNPRPTNEEIEAERKAANKRIPRIPLKTSSATLVVAPLALIRQWESEIQSKTDSLKVLVHHGASRTQSAKKLESYDVVVTTYQTLTSEHESSVANGPQVGCMGVNWYRVILDEAHSIKNRNAKMTKACYALRSVYRWCLTGTPMQNNLDELQSLIRFLNIRPYNDFNRWKEQITIPMKNGRGDLAMRRLQTVLLAFMKRRTKDILKQDGAFGPTVDGEKPQFQIVDRKIELMTVEFSSHERQFYDRLDARAQENLLDVMNSEKNSYMAVLVLLLRLRQSCNHPRLMTAKTDKDSDIMLPASSQQSPSKTSARDMDNIADLMGGLSVESRKCDVCRSVLSKAEIAQDADRCADCEVDLKDELRPGKQKKKKHRSSMGKTKLSQAERTKLRRERQKKLVVDSDDEEDADWLIAKAMRSNRLDDDTQTDDEEDEGHGRWLGDGDSETGEESSDEDDGDEDESVAYEAANDADVPTAELYGSRIQASTKIRHLLQILAKETPSHKVIVFSEFTSMLDLIEPFLAQRGFRWSRYDGSMRNDAREASLAKLRNDSKTRILLCSLKCGSLGLNLTAASRVVLMEPFWNPAIEDQAIDRVHRLNQTRDIVVYRLSIAGTIEDRILELQDKKRALAAAALGGDKNISKLNMQDLLDLFRHDGQHERRAGQSKVGGMVEDLADRLLPAQSSKSGRPGKGSTPARRTVEHPVYGRR